MRPPRDQRNFQELLRHMESAGDGEAVCIEDLLESVGPRSFGSLLLVPSILVVSPMSGIPGFSTTAAILIAVVAIQMVAGRRAFWLPQPVLRRRVSRATLKKVVAFLMPAARFSDKLFRPRLTVLTHRPFSQVIAAVCLVITLSMPPLELIPLANSITATVIAFFAVALVAHDGILALVALTVTAAGLIAGISAVAAVAAA